MHILKYLLIGSVFWIGTFAQSLAEPQLVLGTINFPPYSFAIETEISGVTPALVREAARRANINIDIVIMPATRIIAMTKAGRIDGFFNATWTKERAKVLDYGKEPLINEEIVLITRASNQITWNGDLNSLKGMRIGAVRSFSFGEKMDAAFASGLVEKSPSKSSASNIKMLIHGRTELPLAIGSARSVTCLAKIY